MADGVKNFVGDSGTQFATECGIVVRNTCPMNYHTWESVPKAVKVQMHEKLQDKFLLLRENKVFMEYVDTRLRASWKRFRGNLSAHWKMIGGKSNPQSARLNMDPKCRSNADWLHLCDYWELDSTQKYSEKMEANRGKQVIKSRGGSRSIVNHMFKMTDHETQTPPSPLALYLKMHNPEEKGWLTEDAHIQYKAIVEHIKEEKKKLISEGTSISTTIEHALEKEAIRIVCAKEKTIKSAWEAGVGPVFRKKYQWMTSEAQSSQPHSGETEELRNHIVQLKEELEKNKEELKQNQEKLRQRDEKFDKLSMFMRSKFPDFESTVFATTGDKGNASTKQLGDGNNIDTI